MSSTLSADACAPVAADVGLGRDSRSDMHQHGMKRNMLPGLIVDTAARLQQAGFAACLVGGAVRDCMLGRTPKDYDLATTALPAELMALFPAARASGAHFPYMMLEHGGLAIEIATFRRRGQRTGPSPSAHEQVGSMADDAQQRDFTVNALYYDPLMQTLCDFHDGAADLKARMLRPIGRPEQVLSANPIIALRAIRLSRRLEFAIAAPMAAAMPRAAAPLATLAPGQLLAELIAQLSSGHARACMADLCRYQLHTRLLPRMAADLGHDGGSSFVRATLAAVDESIEAGVKISPGFVFAALLWPQLRERLESGRCGMREAAESVLDAQGPGLGLRRLLGADIGAIWSTQPGFEATHRGRPEELRGHPRFRAGYNFLQLRCEAGEVDPGIGAWWEQFIGITPGLAAPAPLAPGRRTQAQPAPGRR